MSEPVHSFQVNNLATYGIFAETPRLRWLRESDGSWIGTRGGDLLAQCLAQECATVAAANRERVAALEKLLHECACAIEGEDTADFAWSGANVEHLHFLVAEVRAALGEEAKDGE